MATAASAISANDVARRFDPCSGSEITYAHPGYQREWNLFWSKSDLTADFHTYALLWTATDIAFYVDGVKTNARTYRWIYDNDGQPAGRHTSC